MRVQARKPNINNYTTKKTRSYYVYDDDDDDAGLFQFYWKR